MSGVDVKHFNFLTDGSVVSVESTDELDGIIQRGTVTAPELGWTRPQAGEADVLIRLEIDGGTVHEVFVDAGTALSDVETLEKAVAVLQGVLDRARVLACLEFEDA